MKYVPGTTFLYFSWTFHCVPTYYFLLLPTLWTLPTGHHSMFKQRNKQKPNLQNCRPPFHFSHRGVRPCSWLSLYQDYCFYDILKSISISAPLGGSFSLVLTVQLCGRWWQKWSQVTIQLQLFNISFLLSPSTVLHHRGYFQLLPLSMSTQCLSSILPSPLSLINLDRVKCLNHCYEYFHFQWPLM